MCKNLPRANFSRGAGGICTFSEGFRVRSTVACRIPSVWCGVPDTVRLVRRAGCRFVHGLRRDISTAQTDSCVIWPCTIRPALCCPCVWFSRPLCAGFRAGACRDICACAALRVLDLDGVRVAAAAVDDAAGDDDLVALFELHHLPADLQRVVKQHVGALVHLAHNGRDAP